MWLNVPFPPRISLGVLCQPGWEVSVTSSLSGQEHRNLVWQDARHEYDASLAVRTESDYQEVVNHFHMSRGRLHSFPLKDPVDHRCEQSRGIVVLDASESPAVMQLAKVYGSGSFEYERRITRPMEGKVTLYDGSTVLAEGDDYTLDYETGQVTTSIPAGDLAWSGQFYVPVRYDTDKLPTRVVNRRGPQGELLLVAESIPLVEVRE